MGENLNLTTVLQEIRMGQEAIQIGKFNYVKSGGDSDCDLCSDDSITSEELNFIKLGMEGREPIAIHNCIWERFIGGE